MRDGLLETEAETMLLQYGKERMVNCVPVLMVYGRWNTRVISQAIWQNKSLGKVYRVLHGFFGLFLVVCKKREWLTDKL